MELSTERGRGSGDNPKITMVHARLRAGIRATEVEGQTPSDAMHRMEDAPELFTQSMLASAGDIKNPVSLEGRFSGKDMVHAEEFDLSGRRIVLVRRGSGWRGIFYEDILGVGKLFDAAGSSKVRNLSGSMRSP